MNARVPESNGWPDERRTSWTMGGASAEAGLRLEARSILRCSKPLRPAVNDATGGFEMVNSLD